MTRIFVYGTLRSTALCNAVAGGDDIVRVPATLSDYNVVPVKDDVVPLIRAENGGAATGVILGPVTPSQLARLDTYESAFGYQLMDVTVQTADGPVQVKMYLPPADVTVGDGPWSLSHWQEQYEAVAVIAANDLFSHNPPLDHAAIRRNWHMIQLRAWAKHVGATHPVPATLRHDAQQGDATVHAAAPPLGSFFRLQQITMSHTQFDGTQSPNLLREVFISTDASHVLPYDPVRDRVLLVEQIRMGPLLRGAINPWSLEPIAGMVDAFETPDDTAHREAAEEAGLDNLTLIHVSSFYPSPGATTDFFHTYIGLCDLPDDHATTGGLASEAEDLRLHLLPFDDAMTLIQTGEINVGPLVTLLYALGAQRDALRADA